MLYYLFEWLHKLNFPGAGMFGYTSFRALMAVILALLISSIWGDKFINLLKKKQITETQRDAKTDPFGVNKVGVPSMGGVIIIVAILIPCLLLGKLDNIYMILMLITTVWLGSLGFADDYIKIFKKDKEGLHGKFKIIGQVGLGLIVGLTLYLSPDVVIRENIEVHTPGQEMEVIHGTNDLKSVIDKKNDGDEKCKLVYDAFIYQVAKEIGAMSTVLKGQVDAIILTGGIAYSPFVVDDLKKAIGWIAPVKVYPGEDELLALAQGGIRVLSGEEEAKEYK